MSDSWRDKSDMLCMIFDIAHYPTQPKHATHRKFFTNKSQNHSAPQHRYYFVFFVNSLVHNVPYFLLKRLLSLAWAAWAPAVFLNGNAMAVYLRACSSARAQEAYLQSIVYWAYYKRFSWYESKYRTCFKERAAVETNSFFNTTAQDVKDILG